MNPNDSQMRTSKPIFETTSTYLRNPQIIQQAESKVIARPVVNQQNQSMQSAAPQRVFENPMFDPNESQNRSKFRLFEEEKHLEPRETHVTSKFSINQNRPESVIPTSEGETATVTRTTGYSNVPSAVRSTISHAQTLKARSSTIPKERPQLRQGRDERPIQPYFKDKKIVVTGATSGIGRATAIWLLNSGANVALIGRDWDSLSSIGAEFPKQALAIKCDLTRDEQQYDMCNAVITLWKSIDILINAAGVFYEGDIKSMWPQDYDYLMDINLRSTMATTQMFRPYIEKSKGCIVNVSCVAGSRPFAGMYAYCMSKAGIEALTKSLALEMAPRGCRVNAVSPGFVDTNLLTYRDLDRAEIDTIYKNANKNTPLGRLATVEDVAHAIVFLCSNAAQHMTGQVIKLDGARSLTTSGWVKWEGMRNMNEAMEQGRASFIKKVKNYVKDVRKSLVAAPTLKQQIDDTLKFTMWGTTDKNAHITVSSSTYKNIHDDEDEDDDVLGASTKGATYINKKIF